MSNLNFAVIQTGFCVFGAGGTREEALIDASKCLEPDENGRFSPQRIENEMGTAHGELNIIDKEHRDFDSYMEAQGCYTKSDSGQWSES